MVLDSFRRIYTYFLHKSYSKSLKTTYEKDNEKSAAKWLLKPSLLHFPENLFWSECRDSNSGPLEPHSSTLPNCATPRYTFYYLCILQALLCIYNHLNYIEDIEYYKAVSPRSQVVLNNFLKSVFLNIYSANPQIIYITGF